MTQDEQWQAIVEAQRSIERAQMESELTVARYEAASRTISALSDLMGAMAAYNTMAAFYSVLREPE